MRVAVSGSVATDYLMTFSGAFAEVILPEQIHQLSVSFLVDNLEERRGGVAGNICYGMSQLGLRPLLIAAVGRDFSSGYGRWLAEQGVDTSFVHVSEARRTSRFTCVTDRESNQIASFYAGAMLEAPGIDVRAIARRAGGLDLLVVAPSDPAAMLRHTREARESRLPFVADPSQQLAALSGEQIRELIDGAAYFLSNDYELALIRSKTGWSADDLLARVGVSVTTHGAAGCAIARQGEPDLKVAAVPVAEGATIEPTGAGDAFRAGFLGARAAGLSLERSAQVGALVATHAIETVGTQEYRLERGRFLERFSRHYGESEAAEVAPLVGRE